MARVGAILVDLVSSISKVLQRKNNVMLFMVSMSWAIEYLIQLPRPDMGGWDLKTHFITKCTVLHFSLILKPK